MWGSIVEFLTVFLGGFESDFGKFWGRLWWRFGECWRNGERGWRRKSGWYWSHSFENYQWSFGMTGSRFPLIVSKIWLLIKFQFELQVNMEMGGEYMEVFHSKSFDPCAGTPPVEDSMSYFLNQMSKYGSKLNPCPMVPVSDKINY